jgi:hypothetical protein
MTAEPIHEHGDEPQVQVPARELRRLRALERIATPAELAEAEDIAATEEYQARKAAGKVSFVSGAEFRRSAGLD